MGLTASRAMAASSPVCCCLLLCVLTARKVASRHRRPAIGQTSDGKRKRDADVVGISRSPTDKAALKQSNPEDVRAVIIVLAGGENGFQNADVWQEWLNSDMEARSQLGLWVYIDATCKHDLPRDLKM